MKRLYHFFRAWAGSVGHGHPSKKIYVIGVTGTKGKTTVIELLNAILETAGKKTALISSLRVKIGDENIKKQTDNSMPGRGYLQAMLEQAVDAGCNYAIIEATSQGVVQFRHKFIEWNAGVWTNLSPEHIESHGTFEKYRDAKIAFLRSVGEEGGRIFLNGDSEYTGFFANALRKFSPVTYSQNDEATARLIPRVSPARSAGDITSSPFLLSDFNKANIAAAVAVAKSVGVDEKTIEDALRHFKGVPGRMELLQQRPFSVVVDYAHTPDSLEVAYRSLRSAGDLISPKGRLIAVLGAAGGGRDKWKRPEMGKVAAKYCDEIILTDEDPYNENPETILEEIASGFSRVVESMSHRPKFEKILDRRTAIARALALAQPGDAVIMTGKGSEDSIHVARGKKISWNEREVAVQLLNDLRNGR